MLSISACLLSKGSLCSPGVLECVLIILAASRVPGLGVSPDLPAFDCGVLELTHSFTTALEARWPWILGKPAFES